MKRRKQNVKQIEDFILSKITEIGHECERYLDAHSICVEMQANPPAYYERLTNYNFDSTMAVVECYILVLLEDYKITYYEIMEELEKRILNYLEYEDTRIKKGRGRLPRISHFNLFGLDCTIIGNTVIDNTKR